MGSHKSSSKSISAFHIFSALICVLLGVDAIAASSARTEAGFEDGAFCECNERDSFLGMASKFTKEELDQLKQTFTTTDPRKHIDRTDPKFKQLDAIGQIIMDTGATGTGSLISSDLVFTAGHAGEIGETLTFRVGVTPDGSPSRWADTTTGVIVAKGVTRQKKDTDRDWAIIKINRPLGKKYGHLELGQADSTDIVVGLRDRKFMVAGFPGFKDPKYLWGQAGVHYNGTEQTDAASSNAESGSPILYEYKPGQFGVVGVISSAESVSMFFYSDSTETTHKFIYTENRATIYNTRQDYENLMAAFNKYKTD